MAPSQHVDERAEIIPDDLGQGSQDLELSETVPGVVSVWLVGKPVAPTIVVEDDHLSLSEKEQERRLHGLTEAYISIIVVI